MNKFTQNYFDYFLKNLKPNNKQIETLNRISLSMEKLNKLGNKIILIGNGGSAAMSSHVSVDLSKNSGVRSINFNEADLITCFANDFGHHNWMKEALSHYYDQGDMVILISSSGRSKNIINAAKWCIKNKANLVTFSGMKRDNPLININKSNDNLWINSSSYNHIEMIHHIWLLYIVDLLIERRSIR